MKLLDELNIKTNNEALYETALTHTSYANEKNTISYERLEFLGDAVLELVVSEYLYNNIDAREGEMTKLRAHYVCESANYAYSMKLGLNEYLLLGHGEEMSGGRNRKAIVADIYESFIGAVYLDQGFLKAKEIINATAIEFIKENKLDFYDDYKSELQELVQTDKRSLEYIIVDESGPAHNKTFKAIVKIDDVIYGEGVAHTKKEAEQLAAKSAIEKSITTR